MANQPKTAVYGLVFIVAVSSLFLFNSPKITALVAASQGQTADVGTSQVLNPNFGAVKGTLKLVIKDGAVVVAEQKASNYRIYLSKQQMSNYSLIKNSTDTSFSGNLTSIDADGSGSVCSAAAFTTQKMFYDENNDGVQQPNEKDVYSIATDSSGCFAAVVAPGTWDIYG